VLHYVVMFGPLALAYALFWLAITILKRRRKASWAWRQFPGGLSMSAGYLVAGLILALGAFLAARLPGKNPMTLGVYSWLMWGVLMAVLTPPLYALSTALFTKPEEPQDWLLWDKNEANNH